MKAALNHNKERLSSVPSLKHLVRDAVTPQRDFRLGIDALARFLDFTAEGSGTYAGHADRLLPLRRYLIGGISTVARPDAIFDMSVDPARGQWLEDYRIFNLNPAGRAQTRKRRPVVPVTSILYDWIKATDEWFVCMETDIEELDGGLRAHQKRVASIDSGWSTACEKFAVPSGWGPKLIRHSVATVLANKRVNPVELEIVRGHRPIKQTTSRYAIFDPGYLSSVREGIEDLWAELARICTYPLHPRATPREAAIETLSYSVRKEKWWAWQGLNLRLLRCQHSDLNP